MLSWQLNHGYPMIHSQWETVANMKMPPSKLMIQCSTVPLIPKASYTQTTVKVDADATVGNQVCEHELVPAPFLHQLLFSRGRRSAQI